MTILQSLPDDVLEEYKVCQQKAISLGDSIWKTALILGAGSFAGIVTLSSKNRVPDDLRPWLSVVVCLFAIGVLLAWKRFALRWWSIEETMFRRMEHIERQSRLLRANLYIGHLNGRLDFAPTPEEGTFSKPFVHPDLIEDLEKLRNYERRGIRPMTRFIIELNILAWIAFAVLESTSFTSEMLTLDGPTTAKWITTAVFALVFLWRFLVHNWQD